MVSKLLLVAGDDARDEPADRSADLGGGVIKQRVARVGQGRSGGYRMLVAYRRQGRAVFVYGFAKSERENIAADELLTLREIAAGWLDANDTQIAQAIADKLLQEVEYDEGNPTKPIDGSAD